MDKDKNYIDEKINGENNDGSYTQEEIDKAILQAMIRNEKISNLTGICYTPNEPIYFGLNPIGSTTSGIYEFK